MSLSPLILASLIHQLDLGNMLGNMSLWSIPNGLVASWIKVASDADTAQQEA